MQTTFRRLLGAIILIAAVGGASVLALRAQAHQVAHDAEPTLLIESVQHG